VLTPSKGAELLEGQWAVIEPDVLLPVEEVWPVSLAAMASDALLDDALVVSAPEAGRALGVAVEAASSAASSTHTSGLAVGH